MALDDVPLCSVANQRALIHHRELRRYGSHLLHQLAEVLLYILLYVLLQVGHYLGQGIHHLGASVLCSIGTWYR